MGKKYISWRRVSTFKQNRSGLGLEAQKEIIRYFVERDGGMLIADYAECYTGKELSGCTELRKAMVHAKKENAILVIAKSDRFRNTVEALQIYEEMGDGNIMFCDLPHTDKFTLTLFFALAEREALIVSIRTKQALAVKKSQGAKLGAASDKYKEAYKSKTKEERKAICVKKGKSRNARHLESKEVQMFKRILRNVFAEHTKDDDMANWNWKRIKTTDGYRQRVLSQMRDYREIDGSLFVNWDFEDLDSVELQRKLSNYIYSLKRSMARNISYNQ